MFGWSKHHLWFTTNLTENANKSLQVSVYFEGKSKKHNKLAAPANCRGLSKAVPSKSTSTQSHSWRSTDTNTIHALEKGKESLMPGALIINISQNWFRGTPVCDRHCFESSPPYWKQAPRRFATQQEGNLVFSEMLKTYALFHYTRVNDNTSPACISLKIKELAW